MKHRHFDLSKLRYSSQSLLPAILAALPIPEDYEHIEKIEHLLKPIPEDPNKRKSLVDIQKEFDKKIDRLTGVYVATYKHYQEMCESKFREFGKKQDRTFENLRIYGSTAGIWGQNTLTGSATLTTTAFDGSFVQNLSPCGSVPLKPRNWFAKQIVNLLFDTKVR